MDDFFSGWEDSTAKPPSYGSTGSGFSVPEHFSVDVRMEKPRTLQCKSKLLWAAIVFAILAVVLFIVDICLSINRNTGLQWIARLLFFVDMILLAVATKGVSRALCVLMSIYSILEATIILAPFMILAIAIVATVAAAKKTSSFRRSLAVIFFAVSCYVVFFLMILMIGNIVSYMSEIMQNMVEGYDLSYTLNRVDSLLVSFFTAVTFFRVAFVGLLAIAAFEIIHKAVVAAHIAEADDEDSETPSERFDTLSNAQSEVVAADNGTLEEEVIHTPPADDFFGGLM